jgi:hypothetical protein
MLRRFIVAVAAVAALGIGATDASAAWHGHGGGYHGGYRGGYGGYGWGGVGAGLVAGALVGSALAAPYYYGPGPYGYAYAPGAAYYEPRYRYYYPGGSESQCGAVSPASGDYLPCANH